jgi:hypothetical protein
MLRLAGLDGGWKEFHIGRINLLARLLGVCMVALTPSAGAAQISKVPTEMTALQAETAKLGAPLQGNGQKWRGFDQD